MSDRVVAMTATRSEQSLEVPAEVDLHPRNLASCFRCLLPMTVKVLPGLRRKPPRFIAQLNVAGDGLLDRARSISFVLLGSAAAIGLGLVALVSQVGWPNLLDGPIPGFPSST